MSFDKIDVVMLTKNSASRGVKGVLEEVLESLYRNVPINRLIVIDGDSTDGTKEVVMGFRYRPWGQVPEIVWVDDPDGTRATAREKGCHLVETPWFMFLDDDCILCLPTDTEALTIDGWKKYDGLNINDKVLTLNHSSQTLEYQPINRVIIKQFNGDLVSVRSKSLDMLTTPDHNVIALYHNRNKELPNYNTWTWKRIRAECLPVDVKIPASGIYNGSELSITDELLRLCAWIITEGCYSESLSISQSSSNKNNVDRIRSLIQKVSLQELKEGKNGLHGGKISFSKDENAFMLNSRRGKNHVLLGYSEDINKTKLGSPVHIFTLQKHIRVAVLRWLSDKIHEIPRCFLLMSQRQLKILYNDLMLGDGDLRTYLTRVSKKPRTMRATFSSGVNGNLNDQFQELCVKTDIRSMLRHSNSSRCLYVQVAEKHSSHHIAYRRNISKEHYSGLVWCISINNGNFVARRNGTAFITGNCDDWYERAKKYMADDVGLVWGLTLYPMDSIYMNNVKTMAGIRGISIDQQYMRSFNNRGGTHDALIRTSLVKDIKIPADLHFYEDAYLKVWVEKRGFKAIGVHDPCCTHIRAARVSYEAGYGVARLELKYGFNHDKTGLWLFRNWILAVPKTVMLGLRTGEFSAARIQIISPANAMFRGYLKAKFEGIKRVSINWETGETANK